MTVQQSAWALTIGMVLAAAPALVAQSSGVGETRPLTTAEFRAAREKELRSPEGWLTVSGLFFLRPGDNSAGTDPNSDVVLPAGSTAAEAGQFAYATERVWFTPGPGTTVTYNDAPVTARVELRFGNAAEKRPADRLRIGRVSVQLHRSGARLALRLRDPQSALLRDFRGLGWFADDPAWRLAGRFIPYAEPRKVATQNILGDATTSVSPGEVEFVVGTTPMRMVAYQEGKALSFVFRDQTAGHDTYRIRFLSASAPDAQGRVTIDFNRAYNPPCAFNTNTTCPVPLPQNRLKIAVPAGEKLYAPETATK